MAERVRLLIWDLDETFWTGTLSEGGIGFVEAHKEIVIALARRGVVSSICSKNDPGAVEAVLAEHGLGDYFVLPSVDWTPKGPRIRDLIETIGLRAATVMFIDDNPLNLEEARLFSPDLQTRGPKFIASILADPLFAGKDDRELTRLKQYKLLERRRADEKAAGADVSAFLRESRIEVEIETDVEAHLDRFIELINRTNQLNFTKMRLPEEAEAARAEVRRLLAGYQWQAALVRVSDRYGDHGFCGAYAHDSEMRRLHHFAFSCRILGLGVERWLYQKLGRPKIEVKGEVLADLFDPEPVDWIGRGSGTGASAKADAPRFGRITARGSCEIGAITHYFRYNCDDTAGEYHTSRDGGVFRSGHSIFLYYSARGLTPAQMQAARRLGYVEADFATRLFDPAAYDERGHLVILGFGADPGFPLLRHRGSGLIVPFTVYTPYWEGRDITETEVAEEPADFPDWARDAMAFVRAEWDHVGVVKPEDFEALLRFAAARIPASASVRLLGFFTRPFRDPKGVEHPRHDLCEAYNAAMRRVAADFAHVEVIDVNEMIEDDYVIDRLHFRRGALFRIYERIRDSVWPPA